MVKDEDIIGYDALWESMMKCKRGVIWKDSVAKFVLNGPQEIYKLSNELADGTYVERQHKFFEVESPKRRQIMSISFRDRVYQRSLNDVAVYPEMVKHFIYDNCACQKGKGTKFARDRLKCHLQRYFRKYGTEGYILKIDVKGYYPNMRHDVAKDVFKRYLDNNVYERVEKVLDGFPGEVGFYPGSQVIQIAGISILNDIDHYIKEVLRAKYYVRYMDDMVVISNDAEYLSNVMREVSEKLQEIGFCVHPEKTTITPIRDGLVFLGFQYKLTGTGKVILTADPVRVKAERRKLRRLVAMAKEGKITREKVDQCYVSWKAHVSQGNSYHLIKNMDTYYQELWRCGNAENCKTKDAT